MAAISWDQETFYIAEHYTIFETGSGPEAATRSRSAVRQETLEFELKANEIDSQNSKDIAVSSNGVHYEATDDRCIIQGCTGKMVAETRDGEVARYVSGPKFKIYLRFIDELCLVCHRSATSC